MAVVIENEEKSFGLGRLIIWLVVLIMIGLAIYYLFFAPTPQFETIVPAPLESAERIDVLEFDPAEVTTDAAFRSLRAVVDDPVPGETGRPNPFQPF